MPKRHTPFYYIILCISLTFMSCVSTRQSTYFYDVKDTVGFISNYLLESVIQRNDILSVTVSSLNAEASAIFNAPPQTLGQVQQPGYLVNADGSILFPVLGNVKAAGLTKEAFRLSLVKSLLDKKLLLDPIVTVRFQNFRVTVLGEVAHPTVVNVPNEKISLLEALGFAGDMTIYAKRENVLLIREEGNAKMLKRINLNSGELFTSPYYYLRTNDILYIEPNKTRIAAASRSNQWVPIVLSALSFSVIVVDRLLR